LSWRRIGMPDRRRKRNSNSTGQLPIGKQRKDAGKRQAQPSLSVAAPK
jgi:hypothetical protein